MWKQLGSCLRSFKIIDNNCFIQDKPTVKFQKGQQPSEVPKKLMNLSASAKQSPCIKNYEMKKTTEICYSCWWQAEPTILFTKELVSTIF